MTARRIIKLAVLILLLLWEPAPAPDRGPGAAPEDGGAAIDLGIRLDPARPWTSWRVYLDVRDDSHHLPATPESGTVSAPAPDVELGPDSLVRALGGARYVLLRSGIDALPGPANGQATGGRP